MAGVFARGLIHDPRADYTYGDDFIRALVLQPGIPEDRRLAIYAPLLLGYDQEVESRGLVQDMKEDFPAQIALLGIAGVVLRDPEAAALHEAARILEEDAGQVRSVPLFPEGDSSA